MFKWQCYILHLNVTFKSIQPFNKKYILRMSKLYITHIGNQVYFTVFDKDFTKDIYLKHSLCLLQLNEERVIEFEPIFSTGSLKSTQCRLDDTFEKNKDGFLSFSIAELWIGTKQTFPEIIYKRIESSESIKGLISSIIDNNIIGWTNDSENTDYAIPVEGHLKDRKLYTLSEGLWPGGKLKRFELALPTDIEYNVPIKFIMTSPGAKSIFTRAPVYIINTIDGWIIASPITYNDTSIIGAILVVSSTNEPVSICLKAKSGAEVTANCDSQQLT